MKEQQIKRNSVFFCLLMMAFVFSVFNYVEAKGDNLHFSGKLVNDPCVLDPETEEVNIDFGAIVDKYLYENNRTPSEPFVIRLMECDISIGKTANLTFSGKENHELPGLLALAEGAVTGVAIGMELDDNTPLPFNKPTPAFELINGNTEINLKSFVQGEPSAIKNHDIGRGVFNATATFMVEYL
jgi:type 1 fimbria pilin